MSNPAQETSTARTAPTPEHEPAIDPVAVRAGCTEILQWRMPPEHRRIREAASDLHTWYWNLAHHLDPALFTPAEWPDHLAVLARGRELAGNASLVYGTGANAPLEALGHVQALARCVRALAHTLETQHHLTPAIRRQRERTARPLNRGPR
ncbi:hypothetical protein ACFYVL_40940 [Streptomyces sp. NPDC004111]|uniref:hypothetical protein n=1 Tax=Streptomyces sp. NPDC004111 TaxID=3364690 RepID=UPI0036A701C2